MADRIRIEITGDELDLKRALDAAGRDLRGFNRQVDQTRARVVGMESDNQRARRSFDDLGNGAVGLNQKLELTGKAITAIKWGSIASEIAPALSAVNALSAGAIGLAASLGELAGVAPAALQAVSAVGQAVGVAKLATMGITDAIKAQVKAHQEAGTAATTSATQQEAAAQRVWTAHNTLADAQRREEAAQRSLTLARAEARQELDALQQSVADTALSERQAEIDLRQAIQERRKLRADPSASLIGLDQANLSVDQARQQLKEVTQQHSKAQTDLQRMRTRGVNGSGVNPVKQAQDQLAQSDREVARAHHELAAAEKDAADAGQKLSASQTAAQQAMAGLPASAQAFAKHLIALKPKLDDLRKTAADGLLPGATKGLDAALKNFPAVKKIVGETADALGDFTEKAGEMVGSKAWGRDMERIGASNTKVLKDAGDATLHLADAGRNLVVAARPLTEWFAHEADQLAILIDRKTTAARKSGELADFYDEVRKKAQLLFDITGHLAGGLWQVTQAAQPLGDHILHELDDTAAHWENWTKSVEGHNALEDYFHTAQPAVDEMGRLVHDLALDLVKMRDPKQTTALLNQIRTQLLPALSDLLNNLGHKLGPEIISDVTSVVQLIESLSKDGGGLTLALKIVGEVLDVFKWLIDHVPGLGKLIGVTFAALSLYKLLRIGSAISGVKKLIELVEKLGAIQIGEGVAGAAGAAGGAAGAAGQAIKWVKDAKTGGLVAEVAGEVAPVAAGAAGAAAATGGATTIGSLAAGAGRTALGAVGGAAGLATAGALALPFAFIAMQPKLDKLTQSFTQLMDAPRGSKRFDQLEQLAGRLQDAVKAGDPSKLRDVAKAIDQVAKSSNAVNANNWHDFADQVRNVANMDGWGKLQGEAKDSAREFDLMRQQTSGDLSDIAAATKINLERISGDLGSKSEAGKIALSTNFRQAAAAVKQSMADGKVSTKEGLQAIEGYMEKALMLYGFSKSEARNINQGHSYIGGAEEGSGHVTYGGSHGVGGIPDAFTNKRAVGGFIGDPRARGRDTIHALVGEGEAILNAPQQQYAEMGLAVAHQMGLSPYGSLDSLFAGVTTPHYMAPAYASGGFVAVPGTNFTAGREPAIVAHLRMLARRLHETVYGISGYRSPAHSVGVGGFANDPHTQGLAADIGVGSALRSSMFGVPEAILRSVGLYRPFYPADPNEVNHVQLLGGAAAAVKLPSTKIKAPKVKGGGAVGQVVQAGLNTVARAATANLQGLLGGGSGGGPVGAPGRDGGRYTKAQLERLWVQAGGDPKMAELMARIALAESGGDAGIVNSIGATGLWQIHPGGPQYKDPLTNARTAVEKLRTQGLGAWETYTNGSYRRFARGGRVRRYAGGKKGAHVTHRRPHKPKKTIPVRHHARPQKNALFVHGNWSAPHIIKAANKDATRAGDLGTRLDLLVRAQDLTDEQPTLTAAVSALTDTQLLRTGYTAAEITQLRAGDPTAMLEVIDQPAIDAHVSELRAQEGMKGQIMAALQSQAAMLALAVQVLRSKITQRRKDVSALTGRLASNKAKITRLKKQLGNTKDAKTKRSLRRQIDNLQTDNTILAGRIDNRQTTLGTLRTQLGNAAPTLKTLNLDTIPNTKLDIDYLDKEIGNWTGTAVTKTAISNIATQDNSALLSLLQQQNDTLLKQHATDVVNFQTLKGFGQLVGMRVLGSFAQGVDRVQESGLAILHKGETVTPDPQGPYGSQLGGGGSDTLAVEITVRTAKGEVLEIVDQRIRKVAPGVTSAQTGKMARLVGAAPGGRR